LTQGLRCEWAKSKARAARWAEEVELVVEEMRRVVTFLDWKAQWWKAQGNARSDYLGADLRDGVSAYAAKQAHIHSAMAQSFAARWYPALIANDFPIEWPDVYSATSSTSVSEDHDSGIEE
jgi:hypothetical protein